MTGFLLLAGAAVLLTVGAELFAENASAAGRRLGVSVLAIGLVLAGAEPEELVTAVFASAQHHPGIAAGDAIGANITMLTLVLGLAAVVRPIRFAARVRSYALAAAAAGVVAAAALLGGRVGRPGGVVLVMLYVIMVALIWWRERRPPAFGEAAELAEHDGEGDETEPDERYGPGPGGRPEPGDGDPSRPAAEGRAGSSRRDTSAAFLVVAGVVGMAVGGRLAVAGAERITSSLGLRESVVGLTFVALATTAELFALVWAAARRGVEELALAGVLGSATYNATATLGVAALVRPLAVTGISGQAWLAAALPAVLVLWAVTFKQLGRVAGLLLIATYAGYLTLTFG